MMASESGAESEAVLAARLGRLAGSSEGCCVPEYRSLGAEVRSEPRFGVALRRAQALSSEARLLTLALLGRRGALCACEIQAALGVTHATVSQHMQLLSEAGLVTSERRKKWVYYRLTDEGHHHVP